MNNALLDTDFISEVFKGKNPTIAGAAAHYRKRYEQMYISSITVMEIVKGLHRLGRAGELAAFLAMTPSLGILPFDASAAECAGRIYADLQRIGQPIGRADPMIAGIALVNQCVLVSGNVDHFGRIAALGYELIIEDWREHGDAAE